MKKFCMFLLFILISSCSLLAQKPGISIGGNVYFPIGNWSEIASTGFGGSATYEHPFSKNIKGVLYAGYNSFSGDEEGLETTWSMIPVLVGGKFYFTPKQDWYAVALLGANFVTASTSTSAGDIEASSTEFAGNANFGYELKTSKNGALDLSAGFIYITDLSYFGARIAYIFYLN